MAFSEEILIQTRRFALIIGKNGTNRDNMHKLRISYCQECALKEMRLWSKIRSEENHPTHFKEEYYVNRKGKFP